MNLPDPDIHPDLYADVTTKRLLAWLVDVLLISAITAIAVVLTVFTALFFLPLVFVAIGFVYRWFTISARSATPGMRLFAIELRDASGYPLSSSAAFLHTVGYYVSVAVFPAQFVSMAMMVFSARNQGLTDMILGTAMMNRQAS